MGLREDVLGAIQGNPRALRQAKEIRKATETAIGDIDYLGYATREMVISRLSADYIRLHAIAGECPPLRVVIEGLSRYRTSGSRANLRMELNNLRVTLQNLD